MSSENEMIDQSGENQPDENVESQPTSPAVEEPVESGGTPVVSDAPAKEASGEEPDWNAWLAANPEEEEVVPEVEPEEELIELLAEVDEMESAANASTQADDLETVAEAITKAEDVTDHMPAEAVETAPSPVAAPVVEAVVALPAKPKKPRKHPQGLTAKDVVRYFAPCGRCGYFLTGYRAAYGQENFETAVSEERDGWLTLSWGKDIRELLLKSYGRVVESNDLVFNSACPECSRALIYAAPSDGEQSAIFRIEIKPQSGN